MSVAVKLNVPRERIEEFCRKWRVRQFSLFGSVLRDDFGPESDVDVLIAFQEAVPWSLWDWMEMVAELEGIFGRRVDLVERSGLRNPFRRQEILRTQEVIYGG